MHIRNGVAEIKPYALANIDLTIDINANIWKEIAAEVRNPVAAIVKGDLKVTGGLGNFKEFMSMFKD